MSICASMTLKLIMATTSYRSNNLLIDPITADDHVFMFQLLNTEGWLTFIGNRHISTPEAATVYINQLKNPPVEYYVVKDRDQGKAMGIVSFIKRDYLPAHDLGFAFLPEYSGKGHAYEAAWTVLHAKFGEGHASILATTLPHNHRSVNLLLKLGFTFYQDGFNGTEMIQVYRISRP
jgi:[ribosomal protein S5]-alanine N-acetyltransferase